MALSVLFPNQATWFQVADSTDSQSWRERKKNNNNMVRGGSLAMASSVFGAFSLSVGKMKNKATILASSAGDDQCSNAAQEDENSVTGPLKKLMRPVFFESEPNDNEIEALKLYAMAASKNKPKGAQEILSQQRQRWEGRPADGKLLMALVELLVYQEDYDEASRKLEDLRKVVQHYIKQSDIMRAKWKNFHLLKAIVESVKDAREIEGKDEDEDEDDTDKPKEELWRVYCRESSIFPHH